MNALQKLLAFYNGGVQGDLYHDVLSHLVKYIGKLDQMSIVNVAECCYTSTATISRLCKKMGYDSFPEFRMYVSDACKKYRYSNRTLPVRGQETLEESRQAYLTLTAAQQQNFCKTVDYNMVDMLARMMHESTKVSFYSYGAYFPESSLQLNLTMDGKDCVIITDPNEHINDVKTLKEGCMAVVILPVLTERVVIDEIIRLAKANGAKTFVMATEEITAFAKAADGCYAINGTNHMIDVYIYYMFLDLVNITYRTKYLD